MSGIYVGLRLGARLADGDKDRAPVGLDEGSKVGSLVGIAVGSLVGLLVGKDVGSVVDAADGDMNGLMDGLDEGDDVEAAWGDTVGSDDGLDDGETLGLGVGEIGDIVDNGQYLYLMYEMAPEAWNVTLTTTASGISTDISKKPLFPTLLGATNT